MKRTNTKTSHNGEPDFLIHGSAIKVNLHSVNKAPSNHKLLVWNVELPCPEFHARIRIPNRKYAGTITYSAWSGAKNTDEFLKALKNYKDTYREKTYLTLKLKSYKKPIIQKLLEEDADCGIMEIIGNNY